MKKLSLMPAPKPGENFLPIEAHPAVEQARADCAAAKNKFDAATERKAAAVAKVSSLDASVIEGECEVDQVADKIIEAESAARLAGLNLKACERSLQLAEQGLQTAREKAREENTHRAHEIFRLDLDELAGKVKAALEVKERLIANQQEALAKGANVSPSQLNVIPLLTRDSLQQLEQIRSRDEQRPEIPPGMVLVRVLRAAPPSMTKNPISNIGVGETCSVSRSDLLDLVAKGWVKEIKPSDQPAPVTKIRVGWICVRFLQACTVPDYGHYGPGEVAGFPRAIAERLVERREAEYPSAAA